MASTVGRAGRAQAQSIAGGLAQATIGVVEAGLGLAVNATVVDAPAAEAVKVVTSLGSGNLLTVVDTIVHAVPNVILALAQAGGVGLLAAAVVLEGGRRLINGAIQVHTARQLAAY